MTQGGSMCWAWMIRTLLILFSPYLVVTVMTTNSLYFICSSSFVVTYMCIKISWDVALVSIATPPPQPPPPPFLEYGLRVYRRAVSSWIRCSRPLATYIAVRHRALWVRIVWVPVVFGVVWCDGCDVKSLLTEHIVMNFGIYRFYQPQYSLQ